MQSEEDAARGRGKRQDRAHIFDQLSDFGSKQYVQMLEERLSKLESSLEKKPSAQPSQKRAAISQPSSLDARDHPNETGRHLASLSGGMSTGSQGGPPTALEVSSSIVSTASTQRIPKAAFGNQEASADTVESLDITNDTEFRVSTTKESQRRPVLLPGLPGSQSDVNLFRSQLNQSRFRRQVFAPVHSQSLLEPFLTGVLDDINAFHPLFTLVSVSSLLQQQFLAGPRNCDDNPSRWAIVNALFATAIQWKTEHDACRELMPIAWSYFKNAFSIFPELLIRGSDVSAFQALLSMAIFMHGTADARTTSSIISSLVRVLQAAGLHTRGWYGKLDPITAEQCTRVFWIAYCLDSDQMMKQGLPSTFGSEIDLKLPVINGPFDGLGNYTLSGTQEKMNVLRCMAGLAVIQSRICTELYSQRALKMNNTQLRRTIGELNHQLDVWKMDLPSDIRPTYDRHPSNVQLEMPVLLQTLTYYTTAGRINMATSRLGQSNEDKAKLVAQVPAAAARATLQLVQKLPPPPFSLIW